MTPKDILEKALDYKKVGLIENIHYYVEDDRCVFTEVFHFQRGSCCANGCRHCPYSKPIKKGNTILKEEII